MFRTGKIKLNPQINLLFHFLIQKYFFHGIDQLELSGIVIDKMELTPCLIQTQVVVISDPTRYR